MTGRPGYRSELGELSSACLSNARVGGGIAWYRSGCAGHWRVGWRWSGRAMAWEVLLVRMEGVDVDAVDV